MIYDTFNFSHELLLLEARLNILYDVVDKFIINESPITHMNDPKPLFLYDNFSKFDKFKDKIIYTTTCSRYDKYIMNDWSARETVFRSIPSPKSDDIIFHSDLDEIPKPEVLQEQIKKLSQPVVFKGECTMYSVDLYARQSTDGFLMKYGWITEPLYKYREGRNSPFFKPVENACRHHSHLGPLDVLVRKMRSTCHAKEMPSYAMNEKHLLQCAKNRTGFEHGAGKIQSIEVNENTVFKHLLDNKEKYKEFFIDYYDKLEI